jgi:hypothetical protein
MSPDEETTSSATPAATAVRLGTSWMIHAQPQIHDQVG